MTQQYPYPEREHCEPLTDAPDVLRDEIKHCRTGEEFRVNINALNRMYGGSPLAQSLQLFALMSRYSLTGEGEFTIDRTSGRDVCFYAGEILAVHTNTHLLRKTERQQILSKRLITEYESMDYKSEVARRGFERDVTAVQKFRDDSWTKILDELPYDDQAILYEAARRYAYDATDKSASSETFMSGYIWSACTITGIRKAIHL